MPLKRVNFCLSFDDVVFLQEWSQKTGKSQSELVRLLISSVKAKKTECGMP